MCGGGVVVVVAGCFLSSSACVEVKSSVSLSDSREIVGSKIKIFSWSSGIRGCCVLQFSTKSQKNC